MAIKDWKQLGRIEESYGTFGVEWYKEDEPYSYVRVWRAGVGVAEMKRRGKIGAYIVKTRKKGYLNNKKYFKTKSQALKYAREYMRKN